MKIIITEKQNNLIRKLINENRTIGEIVQSQIDPFIGESVDKLEDILINIQNEFRKNKIDDGGNINKVRSQFMENMINLKGSIEQLASEGVDIVKRSKN
jgi:hypothetical protein